MIQTLSQRLNIPEADIRTLLYIETCMAQCWYVEDGQQPNQNQVNFVEKLLS